MTATRSTKLIPNKKYLTWAYEQQRCSITANTLKNASAELPCDYTLLDADQMLFNVQNGTIDLRTGELRPHSPEDMLMKISPIVYDRNATCELFLAFLLCIFAGDLQLIRFVQKAIGYSASIQDAVGRATKIVGNMLQFSRKADTVRTPTSLPEILQQALELAANDYDLKKKYDFRSIEIQRELWIGKIKGQNAE